MVKEIYIRKVWKPNSNTKRIYHGNKRRSGLLGRIMNIPLRYTGQYCLIVPLTESQMSSFRSETEGYKRAERFTEQLLKNPRAMIDKFTERYDETIARKYEDRLSRKKVQGRNQR
jgi:hypothetical protein